MNSPTWHQDLNVVVLQGSPDPEMIVNQGLTLRVISLYYDSSIISPIRKHTIFTSFHVKYHHSLLTWPLIWFNWLGYEWWPNSWHPNSWLDDCKTCLCQRFLDPNSKTSNLAHSGGIPKELSNPYPQYKALPSPTWNWQATLSLGSTELVRKCLLKDRLCLHPWGPSHENWKDLMFDVKKEPTYWYNVYKYIYIYI